MRYNHSLRGMAAAVFALSAFLLLGTAACAGTAEAESPSFAPGLFSWKTSDVNKEDGEIFSVLKEQGLSALYQNFSTNDNKHSQVVQFLTAAKEKDVEVYYLTGDPSWSRDKKGEALCEKVEQAMSYNRKAKRQYLLSHPLAGEEEIPRLAGLVFDVEPYNLPDWDKNSKKLMESFAAGAKRAYELAKENQLQVILCIPWFYDNHGRIQELEALIRDCCDGIAVMNYYRGSEIENIAAEMELARKYGKGVINIYELQKAGSHGLQEINTYYKEGLDALRENYQALTEAYPEQDVALALHHYRALREVLKK